MRKPAHTICQVHIPVTLEQDCREYVLNRSIQRTKELVRKIRHALRSRSPEERSMVSKCINARAMFVQLGMGALKQRMSFTLHPEKAEATQTPIARNSPPTYATQGAQLPWRVCRTLACSMHGGGRWRVSISTTAFAYRSPVFGSVAGDSGRYGRSTTC